MLKPVGINEWQEYYRMTETASYFQSPGWSALWNRYTDGRYRANPLLAKLPSGKTVLIPLTRQSLRGGLGSLWHAAPAGTYGGWLGKPGDALTGEEVLILIRALFAHCSSLTYRLFPMTPLGHGNGSSPTSGIRDFLANTSYSLPEITTIDDHTRVIDCANGYDAIHRGWAAGKGSMKAKLNKAERAGVHIRRVSSEQDLAAYYNIYQSALLRWNPPPSHIYSRTFFELILDSDDQFKSSGTKRKQRESSAGVTSREIWLAEHEGKIVAGAVILTGNQHMTYWHGASDPAFQALRPVNLLIATLIEHCCKYGLRWFDFNPSMGIVGVDRFKQSFGAQAAFSPILENRTFGARVSVLAGRILRRLQKKDSG